MVRTFNSNFLTIALLLEVMNVVLFLFVIHLADLLFLSVLVELEILFIP